MALQYSDPFGGGPGDVQLGSSKIQPRETYAASPSGMNAAYADKMKNADDLVNAMGHFGGALEAAGKKQQALADEKATLTKDLVDGVSHDAPSGGVSGLLSSITGGRAGTGGEGIAAEPPSVTPGATGNPTGGTGGGFNKFGQAASPAVQMRLAADQGQQAAITGISQSQAFLDLNANEALKTNPAAYAAALKAVIATERARVSANTGHSGAMSTLFLGGFDTAATKLGESQNAAAVQTAIGEIAKQQRAAGVSNDESNRPRNEARTRVASIAREVGADPAKLEQKINIENPRFDTNLTAGTPKGGMYSTATGLTQITNGRWSDIKQKMIDNGEGELAKSLTNPNDERQNIIASDWEDKRTAKIASGILGREPTTAENYMFWQTPKYAPAMMVAMRDNPNTKITDIIPAGDIVIRNNPAVFKGGGGTVGEVVNRVTGIMKGGSEYHNQVHPAQTQPRVLLTQDTWDDNATKNKYKWTDFKNSGTYGGDGIIDSRSVYMLDNLSTYLGRKVDVTSAHRSNDYQAFLGQKTNNHPQGDAFDIAIKNPEEQRKAVAYLTSLGAKGIGTYDSHLHFDLGTGRPNQAKDVNTWSKGGLPLDQVQAAVSEGKLQASRGNYYRNTGFQGQPDNPIEQRIRTYAQYGVTASDAREKVLSSDINAAHVKAGSNDAAQAHTDLAALSTNFKWSDAEQEKIRAAHANVDQIQLATRAKDQQKDTSDAYVASKTALEKLKDPNYTPNMDRDFPATMQGREAFQTIQTIHAQRIPVDAQQSANNVTELKARLAGNDPDLLKALGGPDGQLPMSPIKTMAALSQNMPGKFTQADLNAIAQHVEDRRIAGPVGEHLSTQALTENHALIADAFTANTPAMVALSMDKLVQGDPTKLPALVKNYTDRMGVFYKENYATLYTNTVAERGNSVLSFEDKKAVADKALANTTAYGRSLAAIITANKNASTEQMAPQVAAVTDPKAAFQNYIQQRMQTNGTNITDVQFPGVPRGSQVVFKEGTNVPLQTNSGAYAMRLPSGAVYYYNPAFQEYNAPQEQPLSKELTQAPAPAAPAAPTADQGVFHNVSGIGLGKHVEGFIDSLTEKVKAHTPKQ